MLDTDKLIEHGVFKILLLRSHSTRFQAARLVGMQVAPSVKPFYSFQ